jgi:hypothetical protein
VMLASQTLQPALWSTRLRVLCRALGTRVWTSSQL